MSFVYLDSIANSITHGQRLVFPVINFDEYATRGATMYPSSNALGNCVGIWCGDNPTIYNDLTAKIKPYAWKYTHTYVDNNLPYFRCRIGGSDTTPLYFCVAMSTVNVTNYNIRFGTTTSNDPTADYRTATPYIHQNDVPWGEIYTDKIMVPMVAIYGGEFYIGFVPCTTTFNEDGSIKDTYATSTFALTKCSDMGEFNFIEEPENPVFPDPSDGGGYRPIDRTPSSDIIPVPPQPNISISNLGYLNTYVVTSTGLSGMVDEIFPDIIPPVVPSDPTIQEMLGGVLSSITNFSTNYANQNLLNYIIDIHALPVTPTQGSVVPVKVGYKQLSVTGKKVTNDYVDFDCGTLSLSELYGNFLDYTGTKADLYLPFIGSIPIKPEYFQDGILQVIYRFNVIDGSCVAFVLATSSKSNLSESVIGSYSGECCVHMPIYARDFATMCANLNRGLQIATPNPFSSKFDFGEVSGAMATTLGSQLPVVGGKLSADTPSASNFSSSSGFSGIRYPYLVISRQKPSWTANYQHEKGIPLNVTKVLSDVHGFTITDNSVHVDGINCTDRERELIYKHLTTGVILP